MLRMPVFDVHLPKTAAEAVAMRRELPQSTFVAGGTDLLPNLKHGLGAPKHLVSLSHISELKGIQLTDERLTIGAGTTLHSITEHPLVAGFAPSLALAASTVAGPQHRRMGTLGGNVMLDTRCLYYNQSESWRQALGYCLKAEGDWCHVVGSKATCVAAQSSDCVPMLLALGASLTFVTPKGPQEIDLSSLYRQNGIDVHTVDSSSLLTRITIPRWPGHRGTYRKVRSRAAVDFPQLGVAAAAGFDGDIVTELRVAVGAVMPKPKEIKGTEIAVGSPLTDEIINQVAALVHKQTRPQKSLHGDVAWRRHMARIEAHRALETLRDSS